MKLAHIFTTEDNSFTQQLVNWAHSLDITTSPLEIKAGYLDEVDGLVIFHENHDFSKANQEIVSDFEAKQKPISKIDINGTLMVAVSNFSLWLDIQKCKKILVIGSSNLSSNENLERFLLKLKDS
jgi:hypothetical protein